MSSKKVGKKAAKRSLLVDGDANRNEKSTDSLIKRHKVNESNWKQSGSTAAPPASNCVQPGQKKLRTLEKFFNQANSPADKIKSETAAAEQSLEGQGNDSEKNFSPFLTNPCSVSVPTVVCEKSAITVFENSLNRNTRLC